MADAALPALPQSRVRALATVLAIVAVAPFLQTLGFGYVFDDTYAIRDNAALRGWGALGQVWMQQFGGDGGPFFGLYRPLTMTLFAVVNNVGAKWPLWFHLMALLLHVAASHLVWRLLRKALGMWAAFAAALWFAVHPVHVEAVANITNSAEVLVAIWTLLLAALLLQRVRNDAPLGWRTAAMAGALYAAAMFSKESGAMAAPVALVVAWGWHSADPPAVRWMTRRWSRLAVTFGVAIVIVATARAFVLGGPVTGQPIAALGIAGMSAAERAVAMLSLTPRVLELLSWPGGINPHYGPSTFPESRGAVAALGVLIVGAILAAGIALARRGDRRLLASIGVTSIAFLPASNLLVATGQLLAERTLYLPSVGMVMLGGLLLDRALQVNAGRRWVPAVAAVLAIGILWSGARAARWSEHWRNHDRLFARMIAADPRGYAGYWFAGVEATRQRRAAEGLSLLEKAYAIEQRDRGVVLDYGASLTNHGQTARAAAVYRDALRLAPDDSLLRARLRALSAR